MGALLVVAALLLAVTGPSWPRDLVAQAAGAPIEVSEAWILRAPPVVKMHAGYLTLANPGTEPRALTTVTSPAYGRIEMHLAQTVDGIVTMQPVAQVALPPGQRVTFRPGDLHLMLMAPQASLTEAASVVLQLTFDDGSVIETPAAFRRAAPPAESGHGAHEQGSMGAGS
jgi:hypothetical protein